MCFGCDPQSNQYVNVDNSNGVITVTFNTATCTSLDNDCTNFFQDIVNFVQSVTTASSELSQALGAFGGIPSTGINEQNVCGSEGCAEYICDKFIQGFNYDTTAIANSIPGGNGGSSGSGFDKKRTLEGRDLDVVKNFMNLGINQSGDRFVAGILKITGVVDELKMVNDRLRTTTTVENAYSSSGYPAYSNGANSGLDYSVQGGASSLSSWVSLF